MGELWNVNWEKDGVTIQSEKEWWGSYQQMALLKFPRVLPEHEGKYECIGSGQQPFRTTSELYMAGIVCIYIELCHVLSIDNRFALLSYIASFLHCLQTL